MKEQAESVVSYVLGIGFLLYSSVLTHANEIMTLGGLVLLGARLYVDGGKAWRTWKRNKRLDRKLTLPPPSEEPVYGSRKRRRTRRPAQQGG